jgi:site-specific recombinase XerD
MSISPLTPRIKCVLVEPITPDILEKIVLLNGTKNFNLKDLRIACMCLLGYAGFLRFSELASFNRSDISFFPTYVKLYLEKSKTDVYREGDIAVLSFITFPTAMFFLK